MTRRRWGWIPSILRAVVLNYRTPAPVLDVSPLQTWGSDFVIPDTDGKSRAIRVIAANHDEVEMLVGMYYRGIELAKKDGTWPPVSSPARGPLVGSG